MSLSARSRISSGVSARRRAGPGPGLAARPGGGAELPKDLRRYFRSGTPLNWGMNAFAVASWRAAVIGRWTARISGTLMFLLFLAFFFGEGPRISRGSPPPNASTGWASSPCSSVCRPPGSGGMGGLISVAGFGFLAALGGGNVHRWVLCVPALAGAVHLASWARLRTAAPADLPPGAFPVPSRSLCLPCWASFCCCVPTKSSVSRR